MVSNAALDDDNDNDNDNDNNNNDSNNNNKQDSYATFSQLINIETSLSKKNIFDVQKGNNGLSK